MNSRSCQQAPQGIRLVCCKHQARADAAVEETNIIGANQLLGQKPHTV
jgi:hypothetical protein